MTHTSVMMLMVLTAKLANRQSRVRLTRAYACVFMLSNRHMISFTAQIEHLEEELKKVQQAGDESRKVIESKDELIVELERKLEAVQKDELAKLNGTNEDRGIVGSLTTRIEQLQSELMQTQQKCDEYRTIIDSKSELVTALELKIGALEKENLDKSNEVVEYQTIIAVKDDDISKSQKSLDKLNAKINKLSDIIKTKDELIAANVRKILDTTSGSVDKALKLKTVVQAKFSVNLCCFQAITDPSITFDSNVVQYAGK